MAPLKAILIIWFLIPVLLVCRYNRSRRSNTHLKGDCGGLESLWGQLLIVASPVVLHCFLKINLPMGLMARRFFVYQACFCWCIVLSWLDRTSAILFHQLLLLLHVWDSSFLQIIFLFLLVSQMGSFNVFTLIIYLIFPYTLLYTLLPFSLVKIFLQRSHGIIFLKYSLYLLTFEPFLLYLIQ